MAKQIGLVLSGGGFRGAAHIGVIKYLEEIGIHAQYISGVSAGAIVGGMYASGHSVNEMLAFFLNNRIFQFTNYTLNKRGLIDIKKYRQKLQPYFPKDNFKSLSKTLFIAAANISTGRLERLSTGSVIDAVMASSAIPLIFPPVEINGSLYSDGGILDNFPVEPLEGLCDHLIGVHVNPMKKMGAKDLSSIIDVSLRTFYMFSFGASVTKFDRCDLVIEPKALSTYAALEVKRVDEIFEIGYNAAKASRKQLEQLMASAVKS